MSCKLSEWWLLSGHMRSQLTVSAQSTGARSCALKQQLRAEPTEYPTIGWVRADGIG